QQSGGLRAVMLPAQQVQVLDLSEAAALRGPVVVLLDVIGLGGPGAASGAAGDGADGVAQAEVLEHPARRRVALGGQRQEGAAAGVGEHAVLGPALPGE